VWVLAAFPNLGGEVSRQYYFENVKNFEDFTGSRDKKESSTGIFDYFRKKGIHVLIDEMIEVEGVRIFGSPWVVQYAPWRTGFNVLVISSRRDKLCTRRACVISNLWGPKSETARLPPKSASQHTCFNGAGAFLGPNRTTFGCMGSEMATLILTDFRELFLAF